MSKGHRPSRRHVLQLAAVGLAAAAAGASAFGGPTPTATQPADAAARNAHKFDVGGYKLALSTYGAGAPTVVLLPGFGLAAIESDEWNTVRDAIAKTNLVCVYDRLGLGSSDSFPTKEPRTCRDAVRDLHHLLKAAQVPGPYVLVAHSIGGLHARVYVDSYPGEVAGIVLVDSTDPDQDTKWLAALPPEAPGEDPAISKARSFLKDRQADTKGSNPEQLDVAKSMAEARAVHSFGTKPLAVLTHSPDWKMIPDLPDELTKALERISEELQSNMAKLSTDSSHTVAKKAGHHIHADEPDLVIAGIREVLRKIKAGKKPNE